MEERTFEEIKSRDYYKYGLTPQEQDRGIQFILYLKNRGIPLKQIDVNDWSSSIPAIYVTIPYGKTNGGKYRKYYAWTIHNAQKAREFYFEKKVSVKSYQRRK